MSNNNILKNNKNDTHTEFKKVLPNLVIDTEIPNNFDCEKVALAIKNSTKFLQQQKCLSFYVQHYKQVVNGYYNDFYLTNSNSQIIKQHNYTAEQLNEIFNNMDDYDNLDL
ncbi:MAG: hypothetical protein PUK83_06615 [Clostridia bacterium]|nr:hypothetical protein [Clostridia bacterium]MDY5264071.1 hypothetical protein [Eubacteriales bacterium]